MLIAINNITVRVGENRLFEHTNWLIERGQHWTIYGPTGSGKTTLAKAISHNIAIVEGQVLYHFEDQAGQVRSYHYPNEILTFSAETHREFLRKYSEYHQARWQSFEGEDAPLVSDLFTAKANASPFATDADAAPSLRSEIHWTRERLIAMFDLTPLLGRKVHQLSHGESRKLFLALLLMRSPKLLILDDPFTGLDQPSRERLRAGIEQLLEHASPSIFLLTSRVEDIPAHIQHVLLLQDGRVAAQGDRSILSGLQHPPARAAEQPDRGEPDSFLAMVEQYAASLKQFQAQDQAEVIHLQDIHIQYQNVQVLQDITWTVRRGERWALLGGNGAGKSTLLSLILADNPQAYANEVFVFGKKRGAGSSIWETKQKIGWVSPELQIFYEKSSTCREVVRSGFFDSIGLYRRSSPQQASVADGWIRAMELDDLAEKPIYSLSAGQLRLVLLARALVKHPPLLVLDEPCQGLDDAHRRLFLRMIERLCMHAPVTLVYVSHYQDEIPSSITHRLLLDHGQVKAIGPV